MIEANAPVVVFALKAFVAFLGFVSVCEIIMTPVRLRMLRHISEAEQQISERHTQLLRDIYRSRI